MGQNLTSRTISGISWTVMATAVKALSQFVYIYIMARFLTPADYGLVAMGELVLRFATYFSRMGMGETLIQKKELSKDDISAAFSTGIILGIFFYSLVFIIAPFAVYFFDDDNLTLVLRIQALVVLVNGFFIPAQALIRRGLHFKFAAKLTVFAVIVSYFGVGVTMAVLGFGYWSLVSANIVQLFIMGLGSYLFSPHSLRLTFKWEHYKPLVSYSTKTSGISFMEFISRNTITFMTGNLFGKQILGYYDRANRISRLPVQMMVNSISGVLFPVFSRIQDDMKRLRSAYGTAIAMMSFLILPLTIGMAIMGKPIVMVLLGEPFKDSIVLLQIISPAVALLFLSHFGGVICNSTAHLKEKFYILLTYMALLVVLIYVSSPYGVIGLTASMLVSESVMHVGYFLLMRRIFSASTGSLLSDYVPGILSGLVTGLLMYAVRLMAEQLGLADQLILILGIFTGAIGLMISLFIGPSQRIRKEIVVKLDKVVGNKKHNFVFQFLNRFLSALRY